MKTYLGSGVIAPLIIDLCTRWEWSASRSGNFTLKEIAYGTHWIIGWVGLRAGLDAVVKRKIPSPYRDSNPRPSRLYPSAIRLSYPRIHLIIYNHEF
jgi:hypothetical protein